MSQLSGRYFRKSHPAGQDITSRSQASDIPFLLQLCELQDPFHSLPLRYSRSGQCLVLLVQECFEVRIDHQPVAELNCTAEVRECLNTAEDHRILGFVAAPGGLVDISFVDIMAVQHQYLASNHGSGSRCFTRSIGKKDAIDLQFDSAGNVHHFDIVGIAALGKGPATDFQG